MKSEKIGELAKALASLQSEVQGAIKDAKNPFFNSKYADLESCWAALREPLSKNGLAITQTMGFIPECGPTLVTTLIHSSGEWISGEQPISPSKQDPQGLGSAITYARRYGLSAITGLIQVDDDGEAAHGRGDDRGSKTDGQARGNPPSNGALAGDGRISDPQAKRLFAIYKKSGMPESELKSIIKTIGGVESSKDIHYSKYNQIVKAIEDWKSPSAEEIPF